MVFLVPLLMFELLPEPLLVREADAVDEELAVDAVDVTRVAKVLPETTVISVVVYCCADAGALVVLVLRVVDADVVLSVEDATAEVGEELAAALLAVVDAAALDCDC